MVKICNLAINKDKVINNLNLNNNLFNYNQSTTTSTTSDGSSSSSSSSTTTSSSTQTTSSTSGNLYTAGQCTWYVYDRVGGKIGSTWGNANNWASAASAAGYTVNNTPEKVQFFKHLKVLMDMLRM